MVELAKKIKQWFTVLAPSIFNKIEVAEARGYPDQMVGRTLDILVSELTSDPRKSHIKVKLRVIGVEDDKVLTEIAQVELLRSYLRSIVRRRSSKIEAVINVTTRDNAKLRVKPLILTARKAAADQEKAIRAIMVKVVESAAKERTFEAFLLDLVSEKLPKDIRAAVSKLYPIKNAEIRMAETVSEKAGKEKTSEAPKKHAKPEKAPKAERAPKVEKAPEVEKKVEKAPAVVGGIFPFTQTPFLQNQQST